MKGQPPAWRGWVILLGAMGVTFLLGLLAASIVARREESRPLPPPVAIDPWESDSSKWAINYPREYGRYRMMETSPAGPASPAAGVPTKYGHFGGPGRDYLEESPASVILFAGYGFAQEYHQAREHVYSVNEVTETKRRTEKTPATCWTCKSPDVPRLLVQSYLDGLPAPKPGIDSELAAKLDSSKLDPAKFYKMLWTDVAHRDHAPHRLPRLPRTGDDAAADQPARPPRSLRRAKQGHRQGLAPGDAVAGLRPVPRQLLLQARGQLPHLPLESRDAGRADRGPL